MEASPVQQAEILLGDDVEKFLQSDVGRYLIAGIEEYEKEATEDLLKVWPWRRARIAQLQERVRLSRRVVSLLGEAIVAGKQALEQVIAPTE